MRLGLNTLGHAPEAMRPAYDPAGVSIGIVHLGLGAFHRAHQAVFTDDAIALEGGDWGIFGVSMRKPDVAASMAPQGGLYTVEFLDATPAYRIVGAVRQVATLPLEPEKVLGAVASAATHIVTLTVTEKGYCLDGPVLDFQHPDIAHDVGGTPAPRSAIGVLAKGFARRRSAEAGPLTVVSCDNIAENGPRLRDAVLAFSDRAFPGLASWIESNVAFPETMVDSIVPASTEASRLRVETALGMEDRASVQREPFAQWVIQDRFVGPRPAWDKAGVELVAAVGPARMLKLHVLNATHSALAYLGLPIGYRFVREAIADPNISAFLDRLVAEEIRPALPDLDVGPYWSATRARFANPMVDHRLDQIAQDGAFKLEQRVAPLLAANLRQGRPFHGLAAIIRAWIGHAGGEGSAGLPSFLTADPGMLHAVLGGGA